MHSSRMRTGRSLTVYRSLLPGGGGVCSQGGVCSRRASALGGGVCSQGGGGGACSGGQSVCSGGSALGGVVSQHSLRQTPPPHCEQKDKLE